CRLGGCRYSAGKGRSACKNPFGKVSHVTSPRVPDAELLLVCYDSSFAGIGEGGCNLVCRRSCLAGLRPIRKRGKIARSTNPDVNQTDCSSAGRMRRSNQRQRLNPRMARGCHQQIGLLQFRPKPRILQGDGPAAAFFLGDHTIDIADADPV
ncbi:MAG: hypothetical protein RL367_1656, partial [Pseudomonadota bacterium]